MKFISTSIAAAIFAAGAFVAGAAHAGTVIYNTGSAATASVALGINADGSLNTSDGNVALNSGATGLAYKIEGGSRPDGFYDATSPGCLCEGWGVSANGTVSGSANQNFGPAVGLNVGAMTGVTSSSATTTASLSAMTGLTVTQAYAVSSNAPGALFKNTVTITNTTGATVNDVKYVRVMDWDVPFTEFSEYVTIKGTATTSLLEFSNDNGFCSADPLAGCSEIVGGTTNTDFTDAGPADHGAYFKFNLGSLADGESYTFNIFYGAAGSESAALAAIGAESIELFSLGQSSGGELTGSPATYIFGFSGVGGTPVPVPEPGSLALVGLALAGLGAMRRRGSKQA